MRTISIKFGKNKDGKAIRSRNGGGWHVMENSTPEAVKVCAVEVWSYVGNHHGETLKDIAAKDPEYLEMMLEYLHADAKHMDCLRTLLK